MNLLSTLSAAVLLTCSISPVFARTFTNYGPVFTSYKKSLSSGGGCVSGSIGTTLLGRGFQVVIRFVAEKHAESEYKEAFFAFDSNSDAPDIAAGRLRSSVFTMCLKPGRYHIVGVSAIAQYSATRIHMPFIVEPGKHSYIGSFVLHTAETVPTWCPRVKIPMFVEVRDEFARDAQIITSAKHPVEVAPSSAMVVPPNGQSYFIACSHDSPRGA